MFWPLMLCAIFAEVVATTLLPRTNEFRRLKPTLIVAALYISAFALFAQVLTFSPMGVAYALWAGLGTAGIAAVGIVLRGERASWAHGLGMALIVLGAALLGI